MLTGRGLMSPRSDRYPANAEKCQQCLEVAHTSGTKRLFGVLASQWRQLAEEADWTDKVGSRPLLEKMHHSHFLRKIDKTIDKTDDAIRKLGVALGGLTAQERPIPIHQPTLPTPGELTAAGWHRQV
jgi:hypothetical protein